MADQWLACASNASSIPLAAMKDRLTGSVIAHRLAVVGVDLEWQPLNWQLLERGARKLCATHTAPHYRLYALSGTVPRKPGLARAGDGRSIEVEIRELPLRRFGEFVAEVPAPLAIGSLETADGDWVKGFVCEPHALADAVGISSFGSWRAYLASRRG